MEIRCGNCNKLFRVSDDKITGTGIKFACTRCSQLVKVTKEEFEQYQLSQSAVTVLDMFEPKPKPAKAAPAAGPQDFDLSAHVEQETVQDEQPPIFTEPAPVEKPMAAAVEPTPVPVLIPEPAPVPAPEPKPEPPRPEPKPDPKQEQKQIAAPVKPETVAPRPAPAKPQAPRPAASASAKKEPVRPAPSAAVEKTARPATPQPAPAEPSRAGLVVLIVTILALCLAGYGSYVLFFSGPGADKSAANAMVSAEGLYIMNLSGTIDASSDLVISGMVQNALEKERPAWYVVVDIYDAKGAVISKIKLVNGKQIYTKRDYEVLAKRGVNIQDMKAKSLQEQGVIIPPKAAAPFEVRCLQPPAGIASFNANLQPFDPVRLHKEIEADMK